MHPYTALMSIVEELNAIEEPNRPEDYEAVYKRLSGFIQGVASTIDKPSDLELYQDSVPRPNPKKESEIADELLTSILDAPDLDEAKNLISRALSHLSPGGDLSRTLRSMANCRSFEEMRRVAKKTTADDVFRTAIGRKLAAIR